MKPNTQFQPTTFCELSTLLAAFVEKYTATNLFTPKEYAAIENAIEACEDAEELKGIAVKMFSSNYFYIPPDMGIKILRRYLEVSTDKLVAQSFLAQWLYLYGMEHENDGEGNRLLQEITDPKVREYPFTADRDSE